MHIYVIDKEGYVPLTHLFNFISDFEAKTGFGLTDIYEWLDPDLTDIEDIGVGYSLKKARMDYQSFQSGGDCQVKKIPIEVVDAFFSACKNFKIYAGERAKDVSVNVKIPFRAKSETRVCVSDFKEFLQKEEERTDIRKSIIWKLLPQAIKSFCSENTYNSVLKKKEHNFSIPKELAQAICDVYSKIPGRKEEVKVEEGLTIPPFGAQHCFSISHEAFLPQLKQKRDAAIRLGKYKTVADFTDQASALLQSDIRKIFDKSRHVAPRFRVAICLALLDGHIIPQEVLDVHRQLFESSPTMRAKNKPFQGREGFEI